MTTTSIGKESERVAATWLVAHGYKILSMNWRTKLCEIDIVAHKDDIVYFVEVRHRKSNSWGDGVDSITAKKYKQMEFAARLWMNQHKWSNDARIVVVGTSGLQPKVDSFIEV